MADTAATPKPSTPAITKPERPDEEEYKKELAELKKAHEDAVAKFQKLKAQVDNTRPNNKDSPAGKRQAELRAELKEIRDKQQSSKLGRTGTMEKVKRLEEKLKAQMADSKAQRSKQKYRSAEEVEAEISALQKQVDAGLMKLVDEKKAIAEISSLRRTQKGFAGLDEAQKSIDAVKAELAELRKTLDDPEAKALSERYTEIANELDKIKAEQDDSFKSLNALRDQRTAAHQDQQKKYEAVKAIQDAYHNQLRAAKEYEKEARRIRDEKRKAENDAFHRGRRQEAAKSKLEDASAPAYDDEIRTARSLLAHFDPSSVTKQEAAGPGKFAAEASRKIDDAPIKGTALKKKGEDEENYFIGGAGKKKGKKGPRGVASPGAETSAKFSLDLGTIDSLARIGVDPPMSQADVPVVVEKIKEKLAFWKDDQDRKTKENIANAQKEIDRLENEATEANNAVESQKTHVNGSASAGAEQENGGTAEVTDGIKNASIEEKTTTPETTA